MCVGVYLSKCHGNWKATYYSDFNFFPQAKTSGGEQQRTFNQVLHLRRTSEYFFFTGKTYSIRINVCSHKKLTNKDKENANTLKHSHVNTHGGVCNTKRNSNSSLSKGSSFYHDMVDGFTFMLLSLSNLISLFTYSI